MFLLRWRAILPVFLLPALVAVAVARDSVVVFNEIHYHPPGDEPAMEWVELHNQMAVDVDMSAWRIDGGIQYDFPLGTVIPGGGHLVVSRDPEALGKASGVANVLGPFAGSLANGGEEIALYKHNRLELNSELLGRRLMDRLDYADNGLWPAAPDGSGVTLAKRDQDTGTKQSENWTWSAEIGGTPGKENFPSPEDVELELRRVIDVETPWRYNDSGEGLGASWAASEHPVGGSWKVGPGAFGAEPKIEELIGTPLRRPNQEPLVLTHYFETELELDAELAGRAAHLNLTHLVDDGAVFYVNGAEVLRFNMPGGEIDSETLASSSEEAEWIEAQGVAAANLSPGSNRISVEVHQSTVGSSDVAFGMQVDLALRPPSVGGADYSKVVLNEVSAAGDEAFRVELANTGASAIDVGGLLISISGDPDREISIGPGTVLDPGGVMNFEKELPLLDGDRIFVFAPERSGVIDARQASASLRGRVADGEFKGRWLKPDKATFGEENVFALEEAVVINEMFYHAYPDRGFADIPPELGDAVFLPVDAQWRYFENPSGEGLAPGWAALAHPDWPMGAALLGREPSALDEPIRTPLTFSREQVTYYFEADFEFDGDPDSGLKILHYIDDGAVFYLNGDEIGRFNMPAGEVTPQSLAAPSVGNAERNTSAFPDARPQIGLNRLSVEVHQSNVGSSDVVFGAEILGANHREGRRAREAVLRDA